MIRTVRNTFAYLAAIALCGIFTACGEQEQPPEQQPVTATQKKVERQQEPESTGSIFDRTDDLEKHTFTPSARIATQTAELQAESLRPISKDANAAKMEIRRVKNSSWEIQSAIPSASLADQLQKSVQLPENQCFVWTPQLVSGFSRFRIPDIKLSHDSSLLIFLETMGESDGPFGSRLILMSTSNWQVLNILEFRERYFEKFEFIPGSTKIAALCLEQKNTKQKQGFACFDLLTGKEERFQQIDPGIGDTTFLVDRNQNLIVSHPNRAELIVLPLEKTENHTINVASANALAAISPDGKELAVLNPEYGKSIEIFRTSDWLPATTVNVTKTTRAAAFHFTPGKNAFFICGDPDYAANSTFIRADGTTSQDEEVSAGRIIFTNGGKMIYHLTRNENRIDVLDSVTGTKMRTIEVNRTRPNFRRSRPGQVTHLFYIPSCNGLAMFDSNGHFFLVSAEPVKNAKGQNDERAIIFQQQMGN